MEDAIRLYRSAFGKVSMLNFMTDLVTHAHDTAHVVVWFDGTPGQMTVRGDTERLGPKTAATINPFEPHSHAFPARQAGLFLAFYIDIAWVRQCYGVEGKGRIFKGPFATLDLTQRSAATRIMSYLTDDANEEGLVSYEIERFIDSLVQPDSAPRSYDMRSPAANDYRVRKAIKIMQENVAERICFDELARSVGLSRPHFFALFKEQMNVTPNIYWNSLRTDEAFRQLECTDQSLISVACNLGFSTQGNFSRFFRDHVGVAPRTYRTATRTLA